MSSENASGGWFISSRPSSTAQLRFLALASRLQHAGNLSVVFCSEVLCVLQQATSDVDVSSSVVVQWHRQFPHPSATKEDFWTTATDASRQKGASPFHTHHSLCHNQLQLQLLDFCIRLAFKRTRTPTAAAAAWQPQAQSPAGECCTRRAMLPSQTQSRQSCPVANAPARSST